MADQKRALRLYTLKMKEGRPKGLSLTEQNASSPECHDVISQLRTHTWVSQLLLPGFFSLNPGGRKDIKAPERRGQPMLPKAHGVVVSAEELDVRAEQRKA